MDLSIILPIHNEESHLEECVERIQKLDFTDYELILVEDGSTDLSGEIASDLRDQNNNIRLIKSQKKLGKGKAIKKGFDSARGHIICFMDVDMAVPPEQLPDLIQPIDIGEADLTVGTRYSERSKADRNAKRDLPSKIYNFLASSALKTGINDHQCGFKAIKSDSWEEISGEIEDRNWFFDTELIYRAREKDFSIVEIPVSYTEKCDSAVNPVIDGLRMGEKILKLRFEDSFIDVKYLRFALVGGTGALINTAVLYGLTEFTGMYYLLSSALAIETSLVAMFFANNYFTFEKPMEGKEIFHGILRSNLVRSVGIATNIGLLYVLTEFLGIYFLISNIIAIFLASVVNFVGEKRFNWKE